MGKHPNFKFGMQERNSCAMTIIINEWDKLSMMWMWYSRSNPPNISLKQIKQFLVMSLYVGNGRIYFYPLDYLHNQTKYLEQKHGMFLIINSININNIFLASVCPKCLFHYWHTLWGGQRWKWRLILGILQGVNSYGGHPVLCLSVSYK